MNNQALAITLPILSALVVLLVGGYFIYHRYWKNKNRYIEDTYIEPSRSNSCVSYQSVKMENEEDKEVNENGSLKADSDNKSLSEKSDDSLPHVENSDDEIGESGFTKRRERQIFQKFSKQTAWMWEQIEELKKDHKDLKEISKREREVLDELKENTDQLKENTDNQLQKLDKLTKDAKETLQIAQISNITLGYSSFQTKKVIQEFHEDNVIIQNGLKIIDDKKKEIKRLEDDSKAIMQYYGNGFGDEMVV